MDHGKILCFVFGEGDVLSGGELKVDFGFENTKWLI